MPLTPLLFLSPRVPWPLVTGARIRTAALLGALRETFAVHYAGFVDPAAELDGLAGLKLVHLSPERALTRAGKAWLGLSTLAGPQPVTIAKYRCRALAAAVARWIAGHPGGIVHADHLHMAPFLECGMRNAECGIPGISPCPSLPVRVSPCLRVLDEHNVESMILERLARATRSSLTRGYLSLQARRLRAAEASLVARAGLVLAVSAADAAELARLAPGARIEVVPNGADLDYFRPAPGRAPRPGRLIFTGSMNWLPNEDAMVWFVRDILPLLRGPEFYSAFRIPHSAFSLDIVGHAPTPAVRALANTLPDGRPCSSPSVSEGIPIRVTGTVPDVRPYMNEAEIYIVPLRVGGGSRLKILEAFAMGVPVVSTTIGCEGLEARDGEHLLIADTPADFAAAAARLAADPALRAALAIHARAHVEQHFGWKAISRRLVELYLKYNRR